MYNPFGSPERSKVCLVSRISVEDLPRTGIPLESVMVIWKYRSFKPFICRLIIPVEGFGERIMLKELSFCRLIPVHGLKRICFIEFAFPEQGVMG